MNTTKQTTIVIHCPTGKKTRYIKAAAGRKLNEWVLEKLDAALEKEQFMKKKTTFPESPKK